MTAATDDLPKYALPFEIDDMTGFRMLSIAQRAEAAICQAILEKPDWRRKIDDEQITNNWRQEVAAQGEGPHAANFDHVLSHLRSFIQIERQTCGRAEPSAFPCIWQKVNPIPPALRAEFCRQVQMLLETQPKDYHPWSGKTVVDLVHPSLYCWVDKVSTTARDHDFRFQAGNYDGSLPSPVGAQFDVGSDSSRHQYSHYQWLPTEFVVHALASPECGKEPSVSIANYINNLHPIKHAPLYPLIGKIFGYLLPLFENVLEELSGEFGETVALESSSDEDRDEEEEEEQEADDDSTEEAYFARHGHRNAAHKRLAPRDFQPPHSLVGRSLQVIVKMANIELTPERPSYPGGRLHIEGTERENIVATALWYYDIENIQPSYISFQRPVSHPEYEQNRGIKTMRFVFGIENEEAAIQTIAKVHTFQDLAVSFPNAYPHIVSPFELADPTKPGHRKIIVFFLVDPNTKVFDTSVIPPQQAEWYEGADALPNPPETIFPYKIADVYRLDLMEERKQFDRAFAEKLQDTSISLCEH